MCLALQQQELDKADDLQKGGVLTAASGEGCGGGGGVGAVATEGRPFARIGTVGSPSAATGPTTRPQHVHPRSPPSAPLVTAAMGMVLVERLRAAGMTYKILES